MQVGILVFLITFIAGIYSQVLLGFFQQDEWLGFARHILLNGFGTRELLINIFTPYSPHYTPFAFLSINLLFSLFGLKFIGYALVSIVLHLVAAILVFYLAKLLFKNYFLAFAVVLLFGLAAAGYQATAWVVTDLATHGATIFGLLSIIFILKFISFPKKSRLFLSIGSLIVSLLFKEITIGLFVVIPLIFYLFADKRLGNKARLAWIFLVSFIFYFTFRFILFVVTPVSFTSAEGASKNYLFYNAVAYPAKTVVQTIIPPGQILELSYQIARMVPEDIRGQEGITSFDIFAQDIVLRSIEILFLIFILIGILVLLKNKAEPGIKRILAFSLPFILINSLVYVISPERTDIISIIDSRNLYFPSIGTSIFIVAALMKATRGSLKKVFILLLPVLLINIFWLNKELGSLTQVGLLRREILTQIKSAYPSLSKKTVFYTESDASYYGLPEEEKIIPFQSGFGQTLLVWYSGVKKFPKEFFQDKFLWNITDQGYKEAGKQGFGYFRDFDLLAQTVREKNLSPLSVISFRYSSQSEILTDNTQEVRGRLAGYLADKREIDPRLLVITPSINMEATPLIFDRKRETFWNSEVPYATSQTIDIDFVDPRKIVQVRIDSYNNKDQNEVGYEVSTSQDGEDWRTVFYANRYPPTNDGYTDLFFEPQRARFVRIRQIGFHQFAGWVVHELQVYEATN